MPYDFTAAGVVQDYMLLQIGLTLHDIDNIDATRANNLLSFHSELKKFESDEIKKQQAKSKLNKR